MSGSRRRSRAVGWAVIAVAFVSLLTVGTVRELGPMTPEERIESITRRLACPVCDGESVYESANAASVAIRSEVKAQVAAGRATDDEIVAFIVQQFEAQTQLLPSATGFESLVWILPAIAGVAAAVGLWFAFRRWKVAADAVPDDDDRALVDAALLTEPAPETFSDSSVATADEAAAGGDSGEPTA
ncbi:MAG: cytochrome c biosis protein CcmH [Actinomycetota bacterium]|jgi:cytochrome c-type biogenesis protein CcmH